MQDIEGTLGMRENEAEGWAASKDFWEAMVRVTSSMDDDDWFLTCPWVNRALCGICLPRGSKTSIIHNVSICKVLAHQLLHHKVALQGVTELPLNE